MRYPAILTKDGRHLFAEFPGCPGLFTGGYPHEIEALAEDALALWLETRLDEGRPIPEPRRRVTPSRGERVLWVKVPAELAARIGE